MSLKLSFSLWRLLTPFVVGFLIFFIPKPEILDQKAWNLLAIFVGTICGVVLKPLPIPVMALIGMHCCTVTNTLHIAKESLQGFSSGIVWLVVFVFFIARGFIKTKLGHRVAYIFVSILGRYTLGLGYGITLTELFLGPFIPSNAARAGGIVYPIVRSISETLGSRPEDGTSKKLGGFLTMVAFHNNLVVSAIFLSAMVSNQIVQEIAAKQGVFFSWFDWFIAALLPGMCSLIIVPLVLYKIYPPQLKELPQAVSIARKNLRDLGPMTTQEIIMCVVFLTMISVWVLGDQYDISSVTAGLFGVCALLITGILTWQDLLDEHEAWSTVIWLSILVMMSGYLEKYGVIGWFGHSVGQIFSQSDPYVAMFGLSIIYFYSHYFFASNTAHVGAMYGIFLAVAIAAGAPPLISALLLGFFSSLFSSITHYSTGSAPLYFGMGYVEVGEWWMCGFIISVINIVIWIGIGYFWWVFLGFI